VLIDDQSQSVSSTFGVTSVPFSVFVDADGVVLGRLPGAIPMEDLLGITDQIFG
jgi:thioredoxin-related protein